MNNEKEDAPLNVYIDPLIDEVRSVRKAISEQFDNDIDKLYEHLKEVEKTCQELLVDPQNLFPRKSSAA